MAIEFIGDGQYHGLRADVKVEKPAGSILTITDTGDRFISDGTYWWIMNQPTSLSRHRVGTMPMGSTPTAGTGMMNALAAATGIGAIPFVNTDTTNGRYLSMTTLTTLGNRAGYRYNSSSLLNRAMNTKICGRFSTPASADYTLARLYIGVCTNQELTGDAPLDTINGVLVGFLSGGTNYKIFHNDSGATGDYDDDVVTGSAQALGTAIHEFRIVADEVNSRFSIKWNNNPYVHITTDIPTSTSTLTIIYQNETNESAVGKTFRLYGLRVETDW